MIVRSITYDTILVYIITFYWKVVACVIIGLVKLRLLSSRYKFEYFTSLCLEIHLMNVYKFESFTKIRSLVFYQSLLVHGIIYNFNFIIFAKSQAMCRYKSYIFGLTMITCESHRNLKTIVIFIICYKIYDRKGLKKQNFIVFKNRKQVHKHNWIFPNHLLLDTISSTNMFVDDILFWKQHIVYICKTIFNLYKIC